MELFPPVYALALRLRSLDGLLP